MYNFQTTDRVVDEAAKMLHSWMCNEGAAQCHATWLNARQGCEPVAQMLVWEDGETVFQTFQWPSARLHELEGTWLPIRYE